MCMSRNDFHLGDLLIFNSHSGGGYQLQFKSFEVTDAVVASVVKLNIAQGEVSK